MDLDVERAFDITIATDGTSLPPHALSAAMADAVGISKVMRNQLGVVTDGVLEIRAVIVGSDDLFRAWAPTSPSASGVYLREQRLIVVRADAHPDRTMAVLRHEVTHALVHEWVGNLPRAVNEGMAEYFEAFGVSGMGGQVDLAPLRRQLGRGQPRGDVLHELTRLVHSDHDEFYAGDKHANYAGAMAFVASLMRDAPGRKALGTLLQAQRRTPCNSVYTLSILATEFDGGVDALGDRWLEELEGRAPLIHTF
ncbi:MAG: hypothetical protein IPK97_02345 [Ahniella sp.]|nr:hypothetical protein [Ahniella sp.]